MDDYLHEVVEVMVGAFGINEDEAIGRVARQFAHWDLTSRTDEGIFGHEDAEFWAHWTYYGPSVHWWRLPAEELHPLAWP
jgi:hypothetical protein